MKKMREVANKISLVKNNKIKVILLLLVCSCMLVSCGRDDTYKLAKKMYQYKLTGEGYEETLKMAQKGNYDANCVDCFKGIDTTNISLFAYACGVQYDIAKAIYENGANIESSNPEFYKTPLLSALDSNRNSIDMIYWLIDQGADINAVSYNKCSVFQYMRFWEDNEDTQELILFFKQNCDLDYLEKSTEGTQLGSWDKLWDENGDFIFYSADSN